MIIWLASYPRSGNTLVRLILKQVFDRRTYSKYDDPFDIGADEDTRQAVGHEFLGDKWETAYSSMLESPEIYFLKTHDKPENDSPAIYIARDGRMTSVSYCHYLLDYGPPGTTTSLSDVISGLVKYGSWSCHLDLWDPLRRPKTLVIRYEDLLINPEAEIVRIAEFSGISRLGKWKNNFSALHRMNPTFFRKGSADQGAEEIGGEDLELFWLLHADWMKALSYGEPPVASQSALRTLRKKFLQTFDSIEREQAKSVSLQRKEQEIADLRHSLTQLQGENAILGGKLAAKSQEVDFLRHLSLSLLHGYHNLDQMNLLDRVTRDFRKFVREASHRVHSLKGRRKQALPRISVVTPVFNGEAHIRECIDSVITQDYPNLEYIVVDGGSTDSTLEIVAQYKEKITRVISEPDNGMYDAIGKGFVYSTGEILGYLNADDLYEPGGLQRVGEYFRDHPRANVIYHEDTVLIDGWRFPNVAQPHVDLFRLLNRHILFQDGVFFRKGAYFAVGGINCKKKLAGDFDLWLKLARKYRFRRADGHVSCFRIRKGQLSEDLAAYHAELQQSLNLFSLRTWAQVRRWPQHWVNQLRNFYRVRVRPRRLFFPIDFNGIPFPPGTAPPFTARKPICPLTGKSPDRLLFSTRDTRFGDNRINYVYYNSESDLALAYPPLSKDELNSLYRNYYSNPPTEVSLPLSAYRSPYAGYCGDRFSKLVGQPYSRISLPRRFLKKIDWNDHTFGEIKENLGSLVSSKSERVRFLDVGCFQGNLLDEIRKETNWEAYGLDSNTEALEVARSKGHQVWEANAEDAYRVIPDDFRFHMIFLGQTIEHLNNPLAVLRRLKHMLEPGGLLALTTPNLDSKQIRLFGPTWSHWHLPYHRYVFSRRSTRLLSRLLGMKLLCLRTHSHPYWTCLSVQLNQLGIGAAVPHAVNFPEGIVRQARNIAGWSRLLWDWRGRGDYLFAVMKNDG